MKSLIGHALVITLTLAVVSGTSNAVTAYQQVSDFSGGRCRSSELDTGPLAVVPSAVYDNFRLSQAFSITGLTWQGGNFIDPAHLSFLNDHGISNFSVVFWANDTTDPLHPSKPGAAILVLDTGGNANQTFVGTEPSGGPIPDNIFNYSATLPTAKLFNANTTYWLSIQAARGMYPQWGWHTSVVADNYCVQSFDGVVNYADPLGTSFNRDQAFALIGNSVGGAAPEPATMTLLGTGVLGLVGLLRRRRRS